VSLDSAQKIRLTLRCKTNVGPIIDVDQNSQIPQMFFGGIIWGQRLSASCDSGLQYKEIGFLSVTKPNNKS